jgi:hypothetical protein
MTNAQSGAMAEQLQQAERRLRETTQAITQLLTADLFGYAERELRRRFVDSESADLLSDSDLLQLRDAARSVGKQMAQRVERELAWPGLWTLSVADSAGDPGEARRTLRDLPLVWAAVAAVDPLVEQLAAQYHLPADDRQPAGYAPPARFIDRAHLPALTDQLFRQMRELEQVRGKVDAESAESRRRRRAERWAAPQE